MSGKKENPLDPKTILSRLVVNALDFLNRSIPELEDAPKYSVIHFHAAMELFLKARLMAEHWTLVVSNRKEPDWNLFIRGDFHSVSLNDADKRLNKVIGSGLPPSAFKAFDIITKHRNKMMHFFHEAQQGDEAKTVKETIVKEQLNAWYWLYRLVTKQWGVTFKHWNGEITRIDRLIHDHHQQYLEIVFSQLGPEIATMKSQGYLFKDCLFCKFEAVPLSKPTDEEYEIIFVTKCLVCENFSPGVQIKCPECEVTVTFINEGWSSCKCGEQFDPPRLAELLDKGYPKEPVDCSECEAYLTVVPMKDGEYVCASCLTTFDQLESCEYCGALNTGNMEDSYLAGCTVCSGAMGRMLEKDD